MNTEKLLERNTLDLPRLISDFSTLLDFMNLLWWPELSLSPLFFWFGYQAWGLIPYVIQVACYGIITYGNWKQICKLRDIVGSLNAFERQYSIVSSIHCMSGYYVDQIQLHDVNGGVQTTGAQGGARREPFQISVGTGEFLTGMSGMQNDQLKTVAFTTNKGNTSAMYGLPEQAGDAPQFKFQAGDGNHIVSLKRDGNENFCGGITGVIEQGMEGPRLAIVEEDFFVDNDKLSMCKCKVQLPWTKCVTLGITTIPTYLEMLASCMAAGASFGAWSDAAQSSWEGSWSPLLGHMFASHTNLPMALTGMAVFRVFNHAHGYTKNAKVARAVLDTTSHQGILEDVEVFLPLFLAVTAAADSANLLLVAAVTSTCARSLNLAMGKDRTVRFFQKVLLGTVPALWLKISLLQHTYEELGEAGRRAVIVAILLALFAAAEPIKEQVDFIMNHQARTMHARRLDQHADIRGLRKQQFFNLITLALGCTLIIGSFIRFAGVWRCDASHTFQLSTMQCLIVVDTRPTPLQFE